MRVRFWGVRGSVPWATPGSIGHGCNTPCVEIVDEPSGRRLILDAGSGIVGVGADAGRPSRNIPIVLTHYHWDHVQGLPFFSPLYRPGSTVTVWAPALGRQFADIETMFESPFFPVPYDRLPSRPAIRMNGGGRRGDQRVRRVRATAESSGRIVRVSNRRHERRSRVCDRSRVRQRRHRSGARAFFARCSRADRRLALHAGRNARAQRLGAQRLVAVRAIRRRVRRAAAERCFITSRAGRTTR